MPLRFSQRSKHRLRRFKPWVWLGLTLVVFIWLGWMSPVRSQPSPTREPTAEVVVNGRRVFDVQGVGTFTAAARAYSINQRLQEEVQKPDPPTIEVVIIEETGLVTLQSQGTLLATVTEVDLSTPGYPLNQQANDWARLLETALRNGQRERSPVYLRQALLYGLVVLGGAIAIHLFLRTVGRRATRALNQWFLSPKHASTTWEEPAKFFWRLGLIGLKVGLWLIVAVYITDLFPQLRSWRHGASTLLIADNIALGDSRYSALSLLLLLALTIGLWSAAQVVSKVFRNYVLQRARIEPRLQDILSILVQYGLLFLGVIVLLQILGIDASSLAILASLLGVGLGFGIQNITNNFISGFIITLERPIQVGDFIKIGDLVGIVRQVGARSTEINTLDQVTIIVPNSRFLESEVINWSHGNPISRLRVPVGVAYGSDIAQVKTALLEAVKRHPEVLLRPKPEIWFQSFGDSSLNFEIMVWTGDPRKQFRVKSDLNYAIEDSLRRHGLEVPFPQQDLHLRSPQLDAILELLKQQAIGISGQVSTQPSSLSLSSADLSAEAPIEQTVEQSSALPDLLANLDLEALAEAMQGPYGIEPAAHPEQSSESEKTELIKPTYFTGTDAVDWLEQKRDYTHDGAMLVGQWLLHKGLIIAEIEGQDFEDSQALYRFYQS